MVNAYLPLASVPLDQGVSFYQPDRAQTPVVKSSDPATVLMTDLRQVSAVTIESDATLAVAEERMRQRGVRMLLVIGQGDAVVGLITTTDLQGEKPMQQIQKLGGRWADLLVRDIMTPQEKLEVLCMKDVERAKVGNIVATLKRAGRQHALVVDRHQASGSQMLRGIFSAAQISRQLDLEFQSEEVAHTFAEIEKLVMRA